MPRAADGVGGFKGARRSDDEELAHLAHCRRLQRMLFDGGFAGICVPRAYGGQGLTPAHQAAFNREIRGYDIPDTQVPTFTPCMAVILEFGTEEQKARHIPPILKGETFWMQFLSEPSGGSDVAGALTTAVRDGDEWVLNGSKIWTTGAWWADWALCLARTNWDVPKHRGLTVFMLQIHQPGIEIHRIEMLNGSREFCQEFMTDVRIPDSQRIGQVDQGWTVAGAGCTTSAPSPAARPTSPHRPASRPCSSIPPAAHPRSCRCPRPGPSRGHSGEGADRRVARPGTGRQRPHRPHRRADPDRRRHRPVGRHHPAVVRRGRGAELHHRLRTRRGPTRWPGPTTSEGSVRPGSDS